MSKVLFTPSHLCDGLNPVICLTDSNGTLVSTYAYDPYGNLTGLVVSFS